MQASTRVNMETAATTGREAAQLAGAAAATQHVDVSTQADIPAEAPSHCASDDEAMGRRGKLGLGLSPRARTPLYSKEDIREQYCITRQQLDVLERRRASGGGDWLLGCLSSYHDSSCRTRSSLLSVCVRRRAPSDENIPELCRRPLPPPQRVYDVAPAAQQDECAYLRRRLRYSTWLPEDDEPERMERRPIRPDLEDLRRCPAHPDHLPPPPPPPPQRPNKHVSFARSHTLTSFESALGGGRLALARSQERLIDGKGGDRRGPGVQDSPKVVVLEKLKRAPMKTQATQTEVCLGRRPLAPKYLSLSPRTIHRVRMVSQGAQTNGGNGRRLMKSFSEAGGGCFPLPGTALDGDDVGGGADTSHEPLQRTQSEEPPRSPFLVTTPPPAPRKKKAYKEIFIDFEPAGAERRCRKRMLQKTLSEGEILRRPLTSTGSPPPAEEPLEKRVFASTPAGLALEEDEFHENLIYRGLFRKRSVSLEDTAASSLGSDAADSCRSAPTSPEPPPQPPPPLPPPRQTAEQILFRSPFASSDSLRGDQSDGIWNESQATVLHAGDSGHNNGLGLEPGGPASLMALTPSSRRKQLLLLQHQQRSSMDTDALDEELDFPDVQSQPPLSPRIRIDAPPPSAHSVPEDNTFPLKTRTSPPESVYKDIICLPGGRQERNPLENNLSPRRDQSPVGHRTSEASVASSLESCDRFSRNGAGTTATTTSSDLARTDSGRTGTDLSETSEDYVTADGNSGTDTRIGSGGGGGGVGGHKPVGGGGDGSSFESASSLYSLARGEMSNEDLIQVSYSPPPIQEENLSDLQTTTPQVDSEDNQTSTTPRVSVDLSALKLAGMAGAMSPSAESSSSSGSYSIQGSTDDLDKAPLDDAASPPVPSKTVPAQASVSDEDEHSGHYSSPGFYESPLDEADERVPPGERKEWTDEEKRRKKKGFKLDFSPILDREQGESPPSTGSHPNSGSWRTPPDTRRVSVPGDKGGTPPSVVAAPRRGKSRSRSPVQLHRKPLSAVTGGNKKTTKNHKEPLTPGMVRSPAMHEGFRSEDWGTLQRTSTPAHSPEENSLLAAVTSDDSSGEAEGREGSAASPRRHRRVRESPRRKTGGGRSPTQQRTRRRSNSGEERSSSHGPSSRRRSSIPASKTSPEGEEVAAVLPRGSRLSPHRYSRSPGGSPSRRYKSRGSPSKQDGKEVMSPESQRLKALSAESLRSVSPGSDSVFYSEGGEHSSNTLTAGTDTTPGVVCHHCGREVAALSGPEDTETTGTNGTGPDIVQPPAGFADSPEGPRTKPSTRLYKKLEKRFRSEERSGHGERRHHTRYRCEGVRAKSEERGKEDRVKLRPLARSTDASMEVLRGADSDPNVANGPSEPGNTHDVDDDEDAGVYAESYKKATWIYIGDSEEIHVWQKPETRMDEKDEKSDDLQDNNVRRDSSESTGSEKDFKRKYQAITHRMVHRKSSVEMYRRLASKSFVLPTQLCKVEQFYLTTSIRHHDLRLKFSKMVSADTNAGAHISLQRGLEEMLKLMMKIWCKQSIAVNLFSSDDQECDKTVVVRRQSGEFGFRIHGSRPVVVSAIEPDTPAESSGLEVGDIVISVNGVNVLDASHSEVVKLAHAGSDTLSLGVARTCNVLTPVVREPGAGVPLFSGFLWKLSGGGSNGRKWVQRWFCLKRDNCLYYYKSDTDCQPLGALMLHRYNVNQLENTSRPHAFCLSKKGSASLTLAGDSNESMTRWLAVLSHSIERNNQVDEWLDMSNRNLKLPASAMQQPDCFGYLNQLGHHWKRRYCILKDACLYFYHDGSSDAALGMACLHGYRVQNSNAGGKRFAFEILPPEPRQRHYYFYTETEMDKKRWLAALEYSIDRWIKVG